MPDLEREQTLQSFKKKPQNNNYNNNESNNVVATYSIQFNLLFPHRVLQVV